MSSNDNKLILTASLSIDDQALLLSLKPLRQRKRKSQSKSVWKYVFLSGIILAILFVIYLSIPIKERNQIEFKKRELSSVLKTQKNAIENLSTQVSHNSNRKDVIKSQMNEHQEKVKQQDLRNKELEANVNKANSEIAESIQRVNNLINDQMELIEELLKY